MRRRSLSAKERLRLFVLHGGICHICEGKISAVKEAWDIEHPVALSMGGSDDDANMKPAHVRCHKPKTADDLGRLAKAKRCEARYLGARPRKPKSKFVRHLDGSVTLRNPT